MIPPAHMTPSQAADLLVQALPHMQRYDQEVIVIKYGGHAMGDAATAEDFAEDVVLLEQSGLLDHVSKPGDRRDYYVLTANPGERMISSARRRMQNFCDLVTQAAEVVPEARAESRTRLRNLQRFYEFLLEDLEERLQRWQTTERTP